MFSPAQDQGYRYLQKLIVDHAVTGLVCQSGCGLTTILQQTAQQQKGLLIRLADFFDRIETFHPLQLEEGIATTLLQALKKSDCVLVDDFSLVTGMLSGCYSAARPNTLLPALDAVRRMVEQENKRLVLGLHSAHVPAPLNKGCLLASVPAFEEADFSFLIRKIFGQDLGQLDFGKIHRFAPRLTAYQMKRAGEYVQEGDYADTDAFLRFLESRALVSNVNTGEVEQVDFNSLFGVGEVIRQLEVNIITPLERDDLVEQLGLKPKRGVLLYGPPGTGKTTIGRALAHRLRSKFFLIDGTVISGTPQFYQVVQRTFQAARENAPCVLFIDDCDLLFEDKEEPGLYRYLLTMLDGLESRSNAQITIMLTAMNIGSLPPALIRSGRVELWLEMNLPDKAARAYILRSNFNSFPEQLSEPDLVSIAEKTDGLTGADLRRIVTDAKNLYGYDIAQETPVKELVQYFEQAIRLLREHREQLDKAPAFTAAHQPKRKRIRFGEM